MKSFKSIIVVMALTCIPIDAKRPPKPPKEPKTPLTSEQRQAIVAGTAEVMGGILTIIQNPHNAHNVGNSIASMLHGLINIIVERIGKRTMDLEDTKAIEQCIDELYEELIKDCAEIMRSQKL